MKRFLKFIWLIILKCWELLISLFKEDIKVFYDGPNVFEIRGELIPGYITVDLHHYELGRRIKKTCICFPIPKHLDQEFKSVIKGYASKKIRKLVHKHIESSPEAKRYV